MKRLLFAGLVSLVSGIFFAVGIGGVAYLITLLPKTSTSEDVFMGRVKYPKGLEVFEHSREDNTLKLTIRGQIRNTSTQAWEYPIVNARIRAGKAEVGECFDTMDAILGSGDVAGFEIQCHNISGTDLPDNIGYEVYVTEAGPIE